jgi:hypothetical protein
MHFSGNLLGSAAMRNGAICIKRSKDGCRVSTKCLNASSTGFYHHIKVASRLTHWQRFQGILLATTKPRESRNEVRRRQKDARSIRLKSMKSPRVGSVDRTPDNRIVRLSVTVRPPHWRGPDTAELRRELSKKYPVERVGSIGKNPPDPDGSIRLFIVVYLLKEVFGPTLRQIVKDAYALLKKQMRRKDAKKLAIPPAFIYNGGRGKKRRATKRKSKRHSRRSPRA